jgi:hypothetical protein
MRTLLPPVPMGTPSRDPPGHVNAGPVFTCSSEYESPPT